MKRRPRRTVPAAVLALTLLALCAAVVVSLVQRLTGKKEFVSYEDILSGLHTTGWNSAWVAVAAVVAVAAGLVLLALAVWPGRSMVLPLAAEEDLTAGIDRASLRRALQHCASNVEGVGDTRIRLGRRSVRVRGGTGDFDPDDLAETLRAAMNERITDIGLRRTPRVSARLHADRSAKWVR